jgi:hypothetical protein
MITVFKVFRDWSFSVIPSSRSNESKQKSFSRAVCCEATHVAKLSLVVEVPNLNSKESKRKWGSPSDFRSVGFTQNRKINSITHYHHHQYVDCSIAKDFWCLITLLQHVDILVSLDDAVFREGAVFREECREK